MRVHDTLKVWSISVDAGVDHKSCQVERELRRALVHDVPLEVDSQQRGGRDLCKVEAERVNEEVRRASIATGSNGDVVIYAASVPPKPFGDSICSCAVNSLGSHRIAAA